MQSGWTGVPAGVRSQNAMRSRAGLGADLRCERLGGRRRPVGVAEVGAGYCVEQCGGVAHAAGEGELDGQAAEHVAVLGTEGQPGTGRLESEHPAARRRKAD